MKVHDEVAEGVEEPSPLSSNRSVTLILCCSPFTQVKVLTSEREVGTLIELPSFFIEPPPVVSTVYPPGGCTVYVLELPVISSLGILVGAPDKPK